MPKYQAPAGTIVRGWTVAPGTHPGTGGAVPPRLWCAAVRLQLGGHPDQRLIRRREGNRGVRPGGLVGVQPAEMLEPGQEKHPRGQRTWWAENSKEAYATGIADAVTGLKNWHASRTGKRAGPRMHFPRRKKKTTDRLRCTYTTGALRVDGSRTVVLPKVGAVRAAENIRPVWRHVRRGPPGCCRPPSGRRPGIGRCRCDWRSPDPGSPPPAPAQSAWTLASGTIC